MGPCIKELTFDGNKVHIETDPVRQITMFTGGKKTYFVGKPNPLMLRHGLKKLDCHSSEIAFIGDRMDTDIIAGIESELDTVLVLTGVTTLEGVNQFPYRPTYILPGIGDILKNSI